jgi:hypothetical protein
VICAVMTGSTANQNALGELVGMIGSRGSVKSIPLTVREMYRPVVEQLRVLDPRAARTRMVSFACVAIRRLCAAKAEPRYGKRLLRRRHP